MSALVDLYSTSSEPDNYITPAFPSLYWPFPWQGDQSRYLYQTKDIWRFTLYWTLILFGATHFTASTYAVLIQWRNWKTIWLAPVIFTFIGSIEALVGGGVVGGLLGAIYNAGYFSMSTWVPLIWAVVNVTVVIMSSFSIQGGL